MIVCRPRRLPLVAVLTICLGHTAWAVTYYRVESWDKGATKWAYRAQFDDSLDYQGSKPTRQVAQEFAERILESDADVERVRILTWSSGGSSAPVTAGQIPRQPTARPGVSEPRPVGDALLQKSLDAYNERARLVSEQIVLDAQRTNLEQERLRLEALFEKIVRETNDLPGRQGAEAAKIEAEIDRFTKLYEQGLARYREEMQRFKDNLSGYLVAKDKLKQTEVSLGFTPPAADPGSAQPYEPPVVSVRKQPDTKPREPATPPRKPDAPATPPPPTQPTVHSLTGTTWSAYRDGHHLLTYQFHPNAKFVQSFKSFPSQEGIWTVSGGRVFITVRGITEQLTFNRDTIVLVGYDTLNRRTTYTYLKKQ